MRNVVYRNYKFKYNETVKFDMFKQIKKLYFTIVKQKTEKTKISKGVYFY